MIERGLSMSRSVPGTACSMYFLWNFLLSHVVCTGVPRQAPRAYIVFISLDFWTLTGNTPPIPGKRMRRRHFYWTTSVEHARPMRPYRCYGPSLCRRLDTKEKVHRHSLGKSPCGPPPTVP
ncbi:hypothetical protein EDD17DRAFT_383689 [Pisolithus thermaeus]|nr:hypothetical protein EDD17DRAFT_383689 [Pisolithus thermaeus]